MGKTSLLHKIKFIIEIVKTYKSGYLCFLDYFKFIKSKFLIYELKDGTKFKVRTNTNDFGIINEIYINKVHHKIIREIKDNSIIIDIGAQIGVFSILAAKQAKNVQVYSYEPFEKSYALLIKNIALNRLQKNIHAYKIGIGKKKEMRKLYINPANVGGHTFYEKTKKYIKIKTLPLKDIFKKNNLAHCDALKLDCEGAEYDIILNTPRKYLQKIKNISIEYHEYYGDVYELKKVLEKNGFKISFNDKFSVLYAKRK